MNEEGMQRKNTVISFMQSRMPDLKCPLNCHVRISFEMMAVYFLSADCTFNERVKKGSNE